MFRYILVFVFGFLNFNEAFATEDEKFKENGAPNISKSRLPSSSVDEKDLKDGNLEARITGNYSINLTWINEKLDVKQPYVFAGVTDPTQLREKFLNGAIEWSHLNPIEEGGTVNIWYDSKMITPAAVEATRQELKAYPIPLKDVRQSPYISDPENEEVFSETTDVYFRTDLIRAIISLEEVEKGSTNCFIFANCNMTPMSKAALFDANTLTKLKGSGLVMAHNVGKGATNWSCETQVFPTVIHRTTPFENSFFMYANLGTPHHETMRSCLKYILIEGSLRIAKWRFAEIKLALLSKSLPPLRPLRNDVFFLYGKLFSYYEGTLNGYTIGRYKYGRFIEFSEENYIEELNQGDQHVFDFEGGKNNMLEIPTKDVIVPPTLSPFKGIEFLRDLLRSNNNV